MKITVLFIAFALTFATFSSAQSTDDDSSVDATAVVPKSSNESPSILGGAVQGALGAARQRIKARIADRLESLKARIRAARVKRLKALEDDIVAMEQKLGELSPSTKLGQVGLRGMQRVLSRWETKLDKRIGGILGYPSATDSAASSQ